MSYGIFSEADSAEAGATQFNFTHLIDIIAEVAQAHDGSLGIAHSYVDALAKCGVTVVKFQVHIGDAESSPAEPFRTNFSYEDATRLDYWRRMEFTPAEWAGLKSHCDDAGVEFMASTFSQAGVDLLESLGAKRHKVGSGEVSNFLLLEKLGRTGKPVILSSGLSDFRELDAAVAHLRRHGTDLTVLQCTTSYPTPPELLGLNVIAELRERYPDCAVGLSEHTASLYAGIAAVALGAQVLEFHAAFDRQMFGPDSSSSLEIGEIHALVKEVRKLEVALSNPVDKSQVSSPPEVKRMFGKSLVASRNLSAGHVLGFGDLEAQKPAGRGIEATDYERLIGKRLAAGVDKYALFHEGIFES